MCKDRIVTGKQLRDKAFGVDIVYDAQKDPGYHHCTRCNDRIAIVPALPWMSRKDPKKASLDKKGRIKDTAHVWLRHYRPGGNPNDAERIFENQ
jgi:hypothetical protein